VTVDLYPVVVNYRVFFFSWAEIEGIIAAALFGLEDD
jgi:hypothetical protein